MTELLTLLFNLTVAAIKAEMSPDPKEAERQVLLSAQRQISDELARREYSEG